MAVDFDDRSNLIMTQRFANF